MTLLESHSILLLSAICIPFLMGLYALLCSQLQSAPFKSICYAGFAWPLFVAIYLCTQFDASLAGGYNFQLRLPTGLEQIGIYLHLGLNAISMPLFCLAAIVGAAAGYYALHSKAERLHLYMALLLIMQAGLMGTFASVDLFFFYFFHEFALIPTFIMIGVWGGPDRKAVAMELTIYLTLGALISLIGLIALYLESGADAFSMIELRSYLAANPIMETVQSNLFALLLFGFGILVSLFPFHSWAPKGYACAPSSAAMLHAGVLKKFGLYGLLQIAVPLLGSGLGDWSSWLIWLALGNVLIIGLITLAQKDLKLMLGYSSVMHMGYAFLGLATASLVGLGGVLLMMLAHGLSVALLFMLSTCVYHRSQSFDMSAMGGLAQRAPVLAAFFVAATMASIGLPGFGNFWGEFAIFAALAESEATRWITPLAAIGIIISAIYGLRAVANIFFGRSKIPEDTAGAIVDLQFHEKLPAVVLLAGLLLIGCYPKIVSDAVDSELQQVLKTSPVATAQVDRLPQSDASH